MTQHPEKISRRVALTLASQRLFSPVTQAAELLTEGVFKVGMEVTYPPFESYDSNNSIVGLDPDFAALIAQHLQAKTAADRHQVHQPDPRHRQEI